VRSANGAPFVYFGVEAMAADGEASHALAAYVLKALDALCWRWGPAHVEVMLTPRGPRLVEVNLGRWNGIRFSRVADGCFGRNAYDVAVSAYLDDEETWAAVPHMPPARLRAAGRVLHLVSHAEGRLRRLRHERSIQELPSLVAFTPRPSQPGARLRRTTCATGSDLTLHASFLLEAPSNSRPHR
jgi:hypothetical protein